MNASAESTNSSRRRRVVGIVCGALLLSVFAGLSWFSVSLSVATIDEPLHAVAGYLHRDQLDFRIDPEDPPLWKYYAVLPHARDVLKPPARPELFERALDDLAYEASMVACQLYQTAGNNGAQFVERCRAMMLPIGVLLGASLMAWAWQLNGRAAALIAGALFCFDPGFLAHAPLVKNDVAISLLYFLLAWVAWALGRNAAWWRIALASLVCGVALNVKFSGVMFFPVVAALLAGRALLPADWIVLGVAARSRAKRLGAAVAIWLFIVAAGIGITWASYGFRFDPTPERGELLNTSREVRALKRNILHLRLGRLPADSEIDAAPTPPLARAVLFLERHKLLPQAWLFGFLYTCHSTMVRDAFLLDQHYIDGRWYYFPCAMLFKTPLATLAALGLAAALFCLESPGWLRRRVEDMAAAWTTLCLLVPFAIYSAGALTTHLNIGIRHVLPIYPLIFLFIALQLAPWLTRRPGRAKGVGIVLALGLVLETLVSTPSYLSFFNVIARPYRLDLLSDSNFDWGQDLLYVADWQQRHRATPLYLGYWAEADPAFFGIQYFNVPGGYIFNQQFYWPPPKGAVLAVSATLLQGTYIPPSYRKLYEPLRHCRPREILGDTIYLYDWPPRPLNDGASQ